MGERTSHRNRLTKAAAVILTPVAAVALSACTSGEVQPAPTVSAAKTVEASPSKTPEAGSDKTVIIELTRNQADRIRLLAGNALVSDQAKFSKNYTGEVGVRGGGWMYYFSIPEGKADFGDGTQATDAIKIGPSADGYTVVTEKMVRSIDPDATPDTAARKAADKRMRDPSPDMYAYKRYEFTLNGADSLPKFTDINTLPKWVNSGAVKLTGFESCWYKGADKITCMRVKISDDSAEISSATAGDNGDEEPADVSKDMRTPNAIASMLADETFF